MESDGWDPVEARRVAERAEAAPWTDIPGFPWWVPPVAGLWAATFAATATGQLSGRFEHGTAVLFVLNLGTLAFVLWRARATGVRTPMTGWPAEYRSFLRAYVVLATTLVLVVALTGWLAGPWAAGAVALALATSGVWATNRAYARTSQRVRERIG